VARGDDGARGALLELRPSAAEHAVTAGDAGAGQDAIVHRPAVVETSDSMDDAIASVVVPLDGSSVAERALPVAVRLAYSLGAGIALVSAVSRQDEVPERERQLSALPLPPRNLQRIVVVDLDPAGAIHETLRRLRPSVACMASAGRGRTAGFVGSVATDVVARGRDPVVVVGPFVEAHRGRRGVAACVDGTAASGTLITVAARWARLLDEPLVVMTVAETVPPPLGEGPVRRRFGPDGDVDSWLDRIATPARATVGAMEMAAVYDPISPVEGLKGFLNDRLPSIAVLSSAARTGLSRLIFGSVTANVVHMSPSPILVVPRLGDG
jgi:nucleotide-binding universal stress UspA family protein